MRARARARARAGARARVRVRVRARARARARARVSGSTTSRCASSRRRALLVLPTLSLLTYSLCSGYATYEYGHTYYDSTRLLTMAGAHQDDDAPYYDAPYYDSRLLTTTLTMTDPNYA